MCGKIPLTTLLPYLIGCNSCPINLHMHRRNITPPMVLSPNKWPFYEFGHFWWIFYGNDVFLFSCVCVSIVKWHLHLIGARKFYILLVHPTGCTHNMEEVLIKPVSKGESGFVPSLFQFTQSNSGFIFLERQANYPWPMSWLKDLGHFWLGYIRMLGHLQMSAHFYWILTGCVIAFTGPICLILGLFNPQTKIWGQFDPESLVNAGFL